MKLYKKENQRVLTQQKYYAETVALEAANMYNSEMNRFLRDGPVIPEIILGIHTPLQDKCLLAFNSAFLNQQRSHHVWSEYKKKLEADISRSFVLHRNRNDENLRKLNAELTQSIKTLKKKYATGMASFDKQERVTTDLKTLLKNEVQSQVFQALPIETGWRSLQTLADKTWHSKRVDAMKQCAADAATEVKGSLFDHTTQWIQENLTPVTNGKEFLAIFEVAITYARENKRSDVHPTLWEEFCTLVEQNCRDDCILNLFQVQEAISNFTQILESHFLQHNYFVTSASMDEIFHEAQSIMEIGLVSMPEVVEALLHASSKLRIYYDEHNEFILTAQNTPIFLRMSKICTKKGWIIT